MTTEIEWAWLAGLYEGDGSIQYRSSHNVAILSIAMSDLDVLKRCQRITTCGYINGPYEYARSFAKKPIWQWNVSRNWEVRHVGEHLLPHLGERRTVQMKKVLDGLKPVKRRDKVAEERAFLEKVNPSVTSAHSVQEA